MRPAAGLHAVAVALAAAYGVYVIVVMWLVGQPVGRGPMAWLGLLLFGLWALSPALVLGHRAWRLPPDGWTGALCAVGMVAVATLGVAAYQAAFFVERPDAQSALVLVFVPLYQWVGVAVLLALVAWRRRRLTG